jgi:hypothetical protein
MVWIASPSRVTFAVSHGRTGRAEVMPTGNVAPMSASETMRRTAGCQPSTMAIAARCKVAASADRLEGKGLLQRRPHPDDRRAIIIELTDQGRALVPRLPPIFGQVTSQLLAGFSTDEVDQLTTMLQRMLDNLHAAAIVTTDTGPLPGRRRSTDTG